MRHAEVHGGNGFAAATVSDLGFKPTLGATSADAKPLRRRTQTIEVGEGLSAAGVQQRGGSAAGASAGEVSAGATKRPRCKKGEGGVRRRPAESHRLVKYARTSPQHMQSNVTVKAEGSDKAVG